MKDDSPPSCRLLTSWPIGTGIGSGVAVAAKGIHGALNARGFKAEFIAPSFPSGGYLATSARRVLYNLSLGLPLISDRRVDDPRTPLVTFDFDGFFFLRA
ncbi:MAG: hypothetical protein V3S46_01120 [Nitrospinota bacterium]